jgi:hypothetical protein
MTATPKKKTGEQIADATERLTVINADIARLTEERTKKLLADSDAGWPPDTRRIEADIVALKADAERVRETIAAVEKRAADEKAVSDAKARASLIAREEAGFADLLEDIGSYQENLDLVVKGYRALNEKFIALSAGYQFSDSQRVAIGLAGIELKRLTMNYLYKIGTVQNRLGGLPVDRLIPSFPGGQCPKIEWIQSPEKIQSIVQAYEERATYASRIMNGGKATKRARVAASPAVFVTENKKAALLAKLDEAAKDVSAAGTQQYEELLAQLRALETTAQPTDPATMEKSA